MRLIKNSFVCKALGVEGITLYPWVFVRSKEPSLKLLGHEWIHVAQVKKDGLLKFYLKYVFEYFRNRVKGMGHYQAYAEISYEREARRFERCPDLYFD